MSTARLTQRKRIKVGHVDLATVGGGKVYTDSRYANYILARDSRVSIEYVEGLLYSAPLNFYSKAYSSNNHVNSADLARLPIPLPTDENAISVQALITAVERMRALYANRNTAVDRLNHPLMEVRDLVPLYQSPLISGFPANTIIGGTVAVTENQVILANGAFICADAFTARFLAVVLRSLPAHTELTDVRFPRTQDTVAVALDAYNAARVAKANFSQEFATHDREIDGYAYELYGIQDARAVVEESLRTARGDEPDDEDEDTE